MMYIILTGFVLCLAAAVSSGLLDNALNEVPESDDDRLNQALVLVDILKSGYLMLLRERNEAFTTATDIVEQSTCAATTSDGSEKVTPYSSPWEQKNETTVSQRYTDRESNIFQGRLRSSAPAQPAAPVYPWGWPEPGATVASRRFYDVAPQPVPPSYPNMFPFPHRPMRRNFPDYSYYYGPFRRNEYYDENREETAGGSYRRNYYNDENRVETANESSKVTFTTSTISSSNKSSKRKTAARPRETNRKRFTAKSQRRYKYNPRRGGPSPEEVASIKSKKTETSNGSSTTKNQNSSKRTLRPKTTRVNTTNIETWPGFLFKTTLRIFLENSTPLPIPFPENNAFCFTNPKSWLCRSP